MVGSYDLDGDDQLEFFALESVPPETNQSTILRQYELDQDGYQDLIWELHAPDGLLGHFVNATVGDLDGDGIPELITVMNVAGSAGQGLLQPIMFVYRWSDNQFMEEPSASLRLSKNSPFVRCQNIWLLDTDGDGDQELAVSLGAPLRSVSIIDMHAEGDLYILTSITPSAMRTGSGFVNVAAVDYDHDNRDDLILLTREGNTIKAQAYYNEGGVYVEGDLVHESVNGLDKLLAQKMIESDWDADGFKDILLPFQSGHVLALTLTPETLVIDVVPVDGGPLSDVNSGDFNHDGLSDLLLVSGEMNLMTLVHGSETDELTSEYFSLESDAEGMQVFSTLPLTKLGVYLGSVIGAGWNGEMSAVFITELGTPPAVKTPDMVPEMEAMVKEDEELLSEFPVLTPRSVFSATNSQTNSNCRSTAARRNSSSPYIKGKSALCLHDPRGGR